jgi:thiol-disulfide isomerase/thioredoxin
MKKIILILVAVILASCNAGVKDYASIKGKLKDNSLASVSVQGKDYLKDIKVAEDGTFSDTLKAPDGMYVLTFGADRVSLYLKKGYDLDLDFNVPTDGNQLVIYKGIGAETNIYLEEKRVFFMSEYANPESYFQLDKAGFDARIAEAKSTLNNTNVDIAKVDSTVVAMVSKSDEMLFSYLETNYEQLSNSLALTAKGSPSPLFVDYENHAGGTTSLTDLKGKFVYLDIWATWCGPCKREIPHLKQLEEEFKGKDIHFVSISVDNVDGRRGSRESWLKMVTNDQLGGIQLFADNDFNSKFIRDYNINSIPRFILLDPNGNIVDANAIRPSDPQIRSYFKSLGI